MQDVLMKVSLKAPSHTDLCLAHREQRWARYRENYSRRYYQNNKVGANVAMAGIVVAELIRRPADHVYALKPRIRRVADRLAAMKRRGF